MSSYFPNHRLIPLRKIKGLDDLRELVDNTFYVLDG